MKAAVVDAAGLRLGRERHLDRLLPARDLRRIDGTCARRRSGSATGRRARSSGCAAAGGWGALARNRSPVALLSRSDRFWGPSQRLRLSCSTLPEFFRERDGRRAQPAEATLRSAAGPSSRRSPTLVAAALTLAGSTRPGAALEAVDATAGPRASASPGRRRASAGSSRRRRPTNAGARARPFASRARPSAPATRPAPCGRRRRTHRRSVRSRRCRRTSP